MFKLHLDLCIHFVPPMGEHGAGITVTRALELPFAPINGLRVFSRAFDECPEPEGFTLKDVIWDVDRQVFLAQTELVSHDFPMPFIPTEIRAWLDRGWRFGSYRDAYADHDAEEPDGERANVVEAEEGGDTEWDDAEKAHLRTWQQRSAEQNLALKALIRHMAETYDNLAAAYAFDKTGRYFTEREAREDVMKNPHVRKFADAARAFESISFEEKEKWRNRTARYPSIEELANR